MGKQPLYMHGSDVEYRKQNVYMGQQSNQNNSVKPPIGPRDPKLYYDRRAKKDAVRHRIMDQKMSFMEGRDKNTENRNASY